MTEMEGLLERAASSQGHVTICELRPSAAQACSVFFHHLDRQDIRMRFASPRRFLLDDFVPGQSGATAGVAFAAMDAAATILGVVNLADLRSDAAEAAVIIRSDYKRRGIGRSLLAHAIGWAAGKGLSHVDGYVLAENQAMLALARAMGFQRTRWDSDFIRVTRPVSAE
jgi:acetyltransferase